MDLELICEQHVILLSAGCLPGHSDTQPAITHVCRLSKTAALFPRPSTTETVARKRANTKRYWERDILDTNLCYLWRLGEGEKRV